MASGNGPGPAGCSTRVWITAPERVWIPMISCDAAFNGRRWRG